MVKVYVETYGCTLNLADSDIILGELDKGGHTLVLELNKSDVVIINTCTVKSTTENKISNLISRIVKLGKPLIISGCMTANEKLLREIAPNAVIVFTGALFSINKAVDEAIKGNPVAFRDFESKDNLNRVFTAPILRIPICEGCVNNCAFCHTKLARPKLRSYGPKTIVRWIEEGVSLGAKEVQLTAMDSGVYGMDCNSSLPELMRRINEIDGGFLCRLGMINPQHVKRFGNELIDVIKLPKFYKFLHIPVQTGSEKVCKEMNRGHTVADFAGIVQSYRNSIPEISIATDIIVGYPTETKEDFEKTLEFIEKSDLDMINLSKFSARPDTKAKELKVLKTQEVKRRSMLAMESIKRALAKRNETFVGKGYEILITEKSNQKHFKGKNINYKEVVVKNFKGKLGDLVNVEIVSSNSWALFGMSI